MESTTTTRMDEESATFLDAAASVRIEERPGLGRVMIAARDFAPGELVLRERPCLTWPRERADELVSSFLGASAAIQAAVLGMAQPALDADLSLIEDDEIRAAILAARTERASERRLNALSMAEDYQGLRIVELIETLLLTADCNAHAFEERIALFPQAAMANHSCDPSCGHSTAVDGEMRYYASRAIRCGEEMTISYITKLWCTSRTERRRILLTEKLFFCRCPRCSRPEVERLVERQPTHGTSAVMSDSRCSRPEVERQPTHGTSAVMSAVQALIAMECAAAGCVVEGCAHGRIWGSCQELESALSFKVDSFHPPCPELAGDATTAFLVCCKPGGHAASRTVAQWIGKRYALWSTLQFGESDSAVQSMRFMM